MMFAAVTICRAVLPAPHLYLILWRDTATYWYVSILLFYYTWHDMPADNSACLYWYSLFWPYSTANVSIRDMTLQARYATRLLNLLPVTLTVPTSDIRRYPLPQYYSLWCDKRYNIIDIAQWPSVSGVYKYIRILWYSLGWLLLTCCRQCTIFTTCLTCLTIHIDRLFDGWWWWLFLTYICYTIFPMMTCSDTYAAFHSQRHHCCKVYQTVVTDTVAGNVILPWPDVVLLDHSWYDYHWWYRLRYSVLWPAILCSWCIHCVTTCHFWCCDLTFSLYLPTFSCRACLLMPRLRLVPIILGLVVPVVPPDPALLITCSSTAMLFWWTTISGDDDAGETWLTMPLPRITWLMPVFSHCCDLLPRRIRVVPLPSALIPFACQMHLFATGETMMCDAIFYSTVLFLHYSLPGSHTDVVTFRCDRYYATTMAMVTALTWPWPAIARYLTDVPPQSWRVTFISPNISLTCYRDYLYQPDMWLPCQYCLRCCQPYCAIMWRLIHYLPMIFDWPIPMPATAGCQCQWPTVPAAVLYRDLPCSILPLFLTNVILPATATTADTCSYSPPVILTTRFTDGCCVSSAINYCWVTLPPSILTFDDVIPTDCHLRPSDTVISLFHYSTKWCGRNAILLTACKFTLYYLTFDIDYDDVGDTVCVIFRWCGI